MKLFWTGTDSLMLIDFSKRKFKKKIYWWVFRRLIQILEYFIQEHYCDAENIADNIKKFGTRKPIIVFKDKVNYPIKYDKKPHNEFNVIYYFPKNTSLENKFKQWLYGIDIIEKIKVQLPEINFIELDGTKDMSKIYPITDFMIRPNRHDGASRIRQECEINKIPYYWTNSNPNIEDCINAIKKEYEYKGQI